MTKELKRLKADLARRADEARDALGAIDGFKAEYAVALFERKAEPTLDGLRRVATAALDKVLAARNEARRTAREALAAAARFERYAGFSLEGIAARREFEPTVEKFTV